MGEEQAAVRRVKKFVNPPENKGNVILVMSRIDYDGKTQKRLLDSAYKKVADDPSTHPEKTTRM